MIQLAIDKCNVHSLSNQSKFQMLYTLKNSQFSMNTVGLYGPSGGEWVRPKLNVFPRAILENINLKLSLQD